VTPPSWPARVVRSSPVAGSQILAVLSELAVTMKSESGLIAQALTWAAVAGQGSALLACRCVPDLAVLVITRRDDEVRIGADCVAVDSSRVADQEGNALCGRSPRPRILKLLVLTPRDDEIRIGADGAVVDLVAVAGEGNAFPAPSPRPDLASIVLTRRDDEVRIGADCAVVDPSGVAGQGSALSPVAASQTLPVLSLSP